MKKLWAKVLLVFVLPLCAAGQQDPCSINAGGNQIVCFDDTTFTLNGSIGSNVDPASLSWTPVPGFTITPGNSEVATVTASGGGNLPQGTYTFQLNGQCLDGTPLQNSTAVTVTGMPTQAEIFHNGVPTNQLTVCTKASLTGSPVAAGEDWAWFPAIAPVGFNQQDDLNSPATCIRYNTSGVTNCSENTMYYEINNGGCATIDSIDLTFIRRDSNIRIQEPLAQYLCGDTVLFRGSNAGCQAAITWSAITFPAGSAPTVLSPNTQNTYIIFTASGWYSIVYDLAPNGPCAGGSDTVEFYICITNAPPKVVEINTVCDSFPDTICLNTPNFPGANYGPWAYVALGAGPFPNPLPTIIPDAMDPTKAIAIIHDQSVDRYDFNRQYTSDTCERIVDTIIVDGGQVITDTTIICIGNHDVTWQKANLEIVADTVDLLCGGDPFFRVSDHVTITSGAGFSSRMNIIAAPNPCPNCNFTVGAISVPTNQTLNLTDCGIYQFEVIAFTGPCRDTAILTVRVGDLPMPNAGVTADFCVNDTVELVGSSPGVSCVDIDPLWTQLSGPAPLVFLEPETLTNPDIQATAIGSYTLMYSFSTENECILTDTLSFNVIDCDTIRDTCTVNPDISVALVSCAANANGDLVYDFDIRIWDPNGDGLNAILTSANGTVSNVVFTPDYPIAGVLQVTGTYTPVNPSQQICLDLAFPGSSAFCDAQVCMPVPDCDCAISNTSADYPECISESFCFDYEFDYYGPTGATLTFFVDLVNSTPGFTLTSPTGGITPVVGHNVVSLCFSFSGECSEDVHLFFDGVVLGLESCKIWEMVTLPCCPCDEPPCGSTCTVEPDISIDQVRCGANANGDVVYDFDIRIWDPNGDALSAGLSSANGTVSNVVFTPDYPIPGVLQVTGTYTPTNPSQEICLDISFPDTSPFCDAQVCMPVPECECAVSNVEPNYPACFSDSFCINLEFDYFGPQVPLVLFVDQVNSTPGFSIVSPTGPVVPVAGHNTIPICFTFSGKCTHEAMLFFDGIFLGLEGCKIWEMVTLPCCTDGGKGRGKTGAESAALSDAALLLYPNPASEQITLEGAALKAGYEVEVHNLLGQTLLRQRLTQDGRVVLDLQSLHNGTYLVVVRDGERMPVDFGKFELLR